MVGFVPGRECRGNVANTSMSNDYRVKGGMNVLWYGDPGPSSMVNRHQGAYFREALAGQPERHHNGRVIQDLRRHFSRPC